MSCKIDENVVFCPHATRTGADAERLCSWAIVCAREVFQRRG